MQLIEHKFEELSQIQYSIYTCPFSSKDYLDALIVSFHGEYGYGSGGADDARFMQAIVRAALAAWSTFGLVLDFRNLKYEWGDEIDHVIFAVKDE